MEQHEKESHSKYSRVIEVAREAASSVVSASIPWYQKHHWLRCEALYVIFLLYILFFWIGSRELSQCQIFELDSRVKKVQIMVDKIASKTA